MRRLLRIVASCCVVAAGLVVVTPSASGAEGPDAVGWWSKQLPTQDDSRAEGSGGDVTGQSVGAPVRFGTASSPGQIPVETTLPGGEGGGGPVTTGPLPVNPPTLPESPITTPDPGTGAPNPTVPDGGLWVGNDPSGPHAVSALRFRGDIGSGELILTLAPGSTVAGPVVACPIISGWSPGPEGAWRDRPAIDCDRFELSGRLSSDGTKMTFNIPQGFTEFGERVLDIGLRPAVGAGDLFDLYFEAPGPESFVVFEGQQLPPPEPEFPEPDESTLPTTAPSSNAEPRQDLPATPAPSTTVAEETAAPPVDIGGGNGPLPQPVADVFEPFTESRASRIFSVTLLLLLGLGLWYLSGQEVREPRLLGGLAASGGAGNAAKAVAPAADRGRGIGRFKRERSGPPTKF